MLQLNKLKVFLVESLRRLKWGNILKVFLFLFVIGLVVFLSVDYIQSTPQKVRVTNRTSNSFTVTWVTNKPSKGFVFADNPDAKSIPFRITSLGKTVHYDDRDYSAAELKAFKEVGDKVGEIGAVDSEVFDVTFNVKSGEYFTHHVTVRGLTAESEYSYFLGNGIWFFNIEDEFTGQNTIVTEPSSEVFLTPEPAYGKFMDITGEIDESKAKAIDDDTIAYLQLYDGLSQNKSRWVSNSLNDSKWYVDLANATAQDGSNFIESFGNNTRLNLNIKIVAQVKNNSEKVMYTVLQDVAPSPVFYLDYSLPEEFDENLETVLNVGEIIREVSAAKAKCTKGTGTYTTTNYCSGCVEVCASGNPYGNASESNCEATFLGRGCAKGADGKPINQLEDPNDPGKVNKNKSVSNQEYQRKTEKLKNGQCSKIVNGQVIGVDGGTIDGGKICCDGAWVNGATCEGGEGGQGELDPALSSCGQTKFDPKIEACCSPSKSLVCKIGLCTYSSTGVPSCKTGTEYLCGGREIDFLNSVCCGSTVCNKATGCNTDKNGCATPTSVNTPNINPDFCKINDKCSIVDLDWGADGYTYCQTKNSKGVKVALYCKGNKWVAWGNEYYSIVTTEEDFENITESRNLYCEVGKSCLNTVHKNNQCITSEGRILNCNLNSSYKEVWQEIYYDDDANKPIKNAPIAIENQNVYFVASEYEEGIGGFNRGQKCETDKEYCLCEGSYTNFLGLETLFFDASATDFFVKDGDYCPHLKAGDECQDKDLGVSVCNIKGGICDYDNNDKIVCVDKSTSTRKRYTPKFDFNKKVYSADSVVSEFYFDPKTQSLVNVKDGIYVFNYEGKDYFVKIANSQNKEGKFFISIDINQNGEFDQGIDKIISDNSEKIYLNPIVVEDTYDLNVGFNFISFQIIPSNSNLTTAKGLLEYMLSLSPESVYSIARYNGKWEIVGANGAEYMTNDFPIVPGEGYVIKSKTNMKFKVMGNQIVVDNESKRAPINFEPGWNFFGLYGENIQDYTAVTLLDNINMNETDSYVNNISRFVSNKQSYEGVQFEGRDSSEGYYGFDFPVEKQKGYFIRIQGSESINWSPTAK